MPDTNNDKDNNGPHGCRRNNNNKKNQKRKYVSGAATTSSSSSYKPKSSIPRGRPSILVSCDPTRELKCQREFLEILRHDWDVTTAASLVAASATPTMTLEPTTARLTLDQELQQMKQQQQQQNDDATRNCNSHTAAGNTNGPFTAYDTGCKGSILIVCTDCLPMVVLPSRVSDYKNDKKHLANDDDTTADPHKRHKTNAAGDDDATDNIDTSEETKKSVATNASHKSHPVLTTTTTENETPTQQQQPNNDKVSALWDPVPAVDRIVAEMAKPSSAYPDSRYCSKITPLQTIVKADDLNAIAQAVEQLIARHHQQQPQHQQQQPSTATITTTTTITFAIRIHRRLGSDHLTRQNLIDTIAAIVPPTWKADLKHPHVIIWIEIIKTLAGISIMTSPICNLTLQRERRSEVATAAAGAPS